MKRQFFILFLFISGFTYSQEKVTLSVTLEFASNIDANNVSIYIPKLKYDKKTIFSYTGDDAPPNAYGKAFCAINKKWVDDAEYFHVGQEKSTGYIPGKTLGYTDGCGNERRMPVGVAIWPTNGSSHIPQFMDREKEGSGYPRLLWQDLIPILDFGGAAYFHDINNNPNDPTSWNDQNKEEIIMGFEDEQQKTQLKTGRRMKTLICPGNNYTYIDAAKEYEGIVMSWTQGGPAKEIYPNEEPELLNTTGVRREYKENDNSIIEWIDETFKTNNPAWRHLFTHGAKQPLIDLLTKINDTWGKDGSDITWMATADEVYEYFYMRKHANITKVVEGNKITINLEVPNEDYFYFKDLSVIVGGISTPSKVTVNNQVQTLSWKHDGNKALVNVGFNPLTISRAEKYTRLYEISGEEGDKEDALYFVKQLKPELQATFLERINSGKRVEPITLTNVALNKGMEYSLYTDVYFEATPSETPTHYKVGETVDLSMQEWKPWDGGKLWFTLAPKLGIKVGYVQVKNANNESQIYSGTLKLIETMTMPEEGMEIITSMAGDNIEYDVYNGKTINLINAHKRELTLKNSKGEELCTYYHPQKMEGQPGEYGKHWEYPEFTNNQTGYPEKYVGNCIYFYYMNTPSVPNRLVFMLPNGEYQVRIFASSKNKDAANKQNLFYEVNGEKKSPGFSLQNNNKDYIEFNKITVDNSYIVIKYWSNPSNGNMAPINLIEFRSKSYITGIERPSSASDNITIRTEKGKAIINCSTPEYISVYKPDGILVGRYYINEGETQIELPQGIYIINKEKIVIL